jgi:NADP-dependent 3-hydroxy acid dehydrogenase YdfG
MQIKDRVFIVTGASSGIGLSTAEALSGGGAKVALLARSGDALQELSQRLPGSLPVTVDMTQFNRVREAVDAVHKHYGRIDGLVNNAGRSRPVMYTVAPRCAKSLAVASPIPLLPPVTRATFPSNCKFILLPFC